MTKSRGRSVLFIVAVATATICPILMVLSMWLSFGRFQTVLGRTVVVFFDGGRTGLVITPPQQNMPDAWHFKRFDFHWDPWFYLDRSIGLQIGIPLWIPTLIGAAVAWRTLPTKPDPHDCPNCGYDTRNNPTAICPECGRAASTA